MDIRNASPQLRISARLTTVLLWVGLAGSFSTGCDTLYRDLDEVELREADAGADAEVLDAGTDADAADAGDTSDATDTTDPTDAADTTDAADATDASDASDVEDDAEIPCEERDEVCDGVDNDCDGDIDDADDDVVDQKTWYRDNDRDGYGDQNNQTAACFAPSVDWVARPGDCNDGDRDVWVRCGQCNDDDGDGFFDGCDAYFNHRPDCDDTDAHITLECPNYGDRTFGAYPSAVAVESEGQGGRVHVGGTINAGENAVFGGTALNPTSGSAGFVASYARDGVVEWAKSLDGSNDEHVSDVGAYGVGSIAAGGHFDGDLVFGDDRQLGTVLQADETDAFVAALSETSYEWIAHISGSREERVVAVDAGANVFAAGNFNGEASFDGSDFVLGFTSGASGAAQNGFVAAFNSNGYVEWAAHLESENSLEVADMARLEGGKLAVVGSFQGSLSFARGTGEVLTIVATGQSDGFLLVLDASQGRATWLERIDGEDAARPAAVTGVDLDTVAVAGTYDGMMLEPTLADPEAATSDIFLATYDITTQQAVTAASAGGAGTETVEAVAAADGEIAVYGKFDEPVGFGDLEPNGTYLRPRSANGADVYVARYFLDGSLKWARSAPTNSDTQRGGDMAATPAGSLVTVGDLGNHASFWSGSAQPVELTATGNDPGFVVHLRRSGAACGETGGTLAGSPWPMDGFCPTRRGVAPVVGPSGEFSLSSVWLTSLPSGPASGPVAGASGALFVVSSDGALHTISANGQLDGGSFPVEQWSAGNQTYVAYESEASTPVISANGTISYGLKKRRVSDGVQYGSVISVSTQGNYLSSYATATGTANNEPYNVVYSSPLLDSSSNLFFSSIGGSLYGISNGTTEIFTIPGSTRVDGSVAPALGADGRIYAVIENPTNDEFTAFDKSGNELCASRIDLGGKVVADLAVGLDETVYVGTLTGQLFAIDGRRCSVIWTYGLGGAVHGRVAIDADGYLYVGTVEPSGGKIYSLDPNEPGNVGKMIVEQVSGGVVASPIVDARSRVFVGSTNGEVYRIDRKAADEVKLVFTFTSPVRQTAAFDSQGRLIVVEEGDPSASGSAEIRALESP
ncbi:PQQ-like beta-propeller repeat protein [Persicimonas caeni]|uniref:PQQ-like beta-propeller repeat protein n=1 Tax=Persicimonas caeni TaxID=2292766 RepID=A0A4Y6PX17_PERCE|nr:PQQ-binding-like beta-propeller repeat protein [Persicimonas caeni]QDG52295.1 PQQ-like beta-propeller repeat protein [Persicimonas caeni]QED33517.1 PQQ-like beta-propeller repeat protein [Persicimonas caeni]